jgi:hypothetical protein
MNDDAMATTKVDPYQDPSYHHPQAFKPCQTPETLACIQACLDCYKTCLCEAMGESLNVGGAHVEPHHFRLMMNCAGICQTAASFMLSNSPFHDAVCGICAQVCEACAESCDGIESLTDCAIQCRKCSESCREMALHELALVAA